MHDALFADQRHLDDASLVARAAALRLDLTGFRACIAKDSAGPVRASSAQAEAMKLTGTPAFIVGRLASDGRVEATTVLAGAQPASAFEAALGGTRSWKGLAAMGGLTTVLGLTGTGLARRRRKGR